MRCYLRLRWRSLLIIVAVLGVGAFVYPAWRHFYPVTAAAGWDYRVFARGIPMVSALALDDQGGLFVSQEITNQRGKVLLLKPGGEVSTVLTGLSKPDGLVLFKGSLVVGQEGGVLPVLWAQGSQTKALFEGDRIEGGTTDGHVLYAIEDKHQGRLLRYDPESQQLSVLREGLDEGEGVTVCPDGRLFYTEKGEGWVKQWQSRGQDNIVAEGLKAPGFVLCTTDGLWITEDATHGARVLLLDATGQLKTVLAHLRAAQTIIALEAGRYLLSEQGRNRILELYRVRTTPDAH